MWTPNRQKPFLRCSSEIGVVEIAGVDGVDRDDGFGGEIEAAVSRFVELLGLLAGVLLHVVGEIAGQIEFVDDRHGVDAGLAAGAEDFDDHAFAVVNVRREADHFDDDFVVGPGAFRAGVADVDRLGKQLAVGLHVSVAGGFEIGADELMRFALQNFDDIAFGIGAADIALARDGDQDRVATGCILCVIGGDENIAAAIARGAASLGRTNP